MSFADAAEARPSLGAGRIIGESFSIFFRNLWKIIGLAAVASVIALLVSGALNGFDVMFGAEPRALESSGAVLKFLLDLLIGVALSSVGFALLVLLAYDIKQGRARPFGAYLALALRRIFPLTVVAVVSGTLVALGLMLLVVPGLWVAAVFAVACPAVVIEGAGLRGLRRSASLTKGYRWPITGVFVVLGGCTYALLVAAGFGSNLLYEIGGGGGGAIVVSLLINVLASAIMYGLLGVSIALIYARLREIKEGVTVSDLAAVFD